ncbi:hypothetical protein [Actinomycetospora termitidis]|uniref:Uncharacterized protein n=1 Tax=Actinomycetospora termitidis TaxID=3053470 RepID=A0ABT7MDC6_9PSEU|nr:hypothetical protein [Actinomycetospora sp. Odt1-22]MDL5158678.1 hypothetical protein [Actinomycetospora sp. Odt1-22]
MAGERWRPERAAERAAARHTRDDELAVQLPSTFLDDPELQGLVPGAEIDVAPALFVAETSPPDGGPAGWRHDELGLVHARGTVLTATPASGGPPPVSVLDTGERLFPLFWSTTQPVEGPVTVGGALYLDPDLAAGSALGEQVALCRERYRVTGLRVSPRLSWRPGPGLRLTEVPRDLDDDLVLVVGLLPVGVPDTPRFPTLG